MSNTSNRIFNLGQDSTMNLRLFRTLWGGRRSKRAIHLQQNMNRNGNASVSDTKLSISRKTAKDHRKLVKSKKLSDKDSSKTKTKRKCSTKFDPMVLRSRSDIGVARSREHISNPLIGDVILRSGKKVNRQLMQTEKAMRFGGKESTKAIMKSTKEKQNDTITRSLYRVTGSKNKKKRERRTGTIAKGLTHPESIFKGTQHTSDTSQSRYTLATQTSVFAPFVQTKSGTTAPIASGRMRWADVVAGNSARNVSLMTSPTSSHQSPFRSTYNQPTTVTNTSHIDDQPSTSMNAHCKPSTVPAHSFGSTNANSEQKTVVEKPIISSSPFNLTRNDKAKTTETPETKMCPDLTVTDKATQFAGVPNTKASSPKSPWAKARCGQLDEDNYSEFFPSLSDKKSNQIAKGLLNKQKIVDRNSEKSPRTPWRQVTKQIRPKNQLAIPIQHQSTIREKKKRVRERKKMARLKTRGNNTANTSTVETRKNQDKAKPNRLFQNNINSGTNKKACIVKHDNTNCSSFSFENIWNTAQQPLGVAVNNTDVSNQAGNFIVGWKTSAAQIASSHDMEICSQLSAMSVDADSQVVSKPTENIRTARLNREAIRANCSDGPKRVSARYRALLRRDCGKVDVKTGTTLLNSGRRVKSHQTEKTFDRFDSHQQRRNGGGTDEDTINALSQVDPQEGTSLQTRDQPLSELRFVPQWGSPEMEFVLSHMNALNELDRQQQSD